MSNQKSSIRWVWVFAVLLIGTPIVLVGGAVYWWTARNSRATKELQQRREQVMARGLPVDGASFEAFRNATMDHRHSQEWMAAMDELASDEFTETYLGVPLFDVPRDEAPFTPGEPYEQETVVSDFLSRHRDLVDKLKSFLPDAGPIWTEMEFQSINTLLPYAQHSRHASRLLALDFEDAVRKSDESRAFESLMAMFGVARSLQGEPMLVCQLVHVATCDMALERLKIGIEEDLFSDEQLAMLQSKLDQLDDLAATHRLAVAGERACWQPVFDDPQLASESRTAAGPRPIDALYSLDLLERMERIPTENLDQFLEGHRELEADLEDDMDAGPLRQIELLISFLSLPATAAYARAMANHFTKIRLARLGIAVRLFKRTTRQFPRDLAELATVEFDVVKCSPTGGKPFGYRLDGGFAELWGFEIHNGQTLIGPALTQTPNQPIDPASVEMAVRDEWQYWYWKLQSTRIVP